MWRCGAGEENGCLLGLRLYQYMPFKYRVTALALVMFWKAHIVVVLPSIGSRSVIAHSTDSHTFQEVGNRNLT